MSGSAEILQAQWLKQAQAGDYDAFERLYAVLEASITRFVRRLVGANQEAEDIVQDTFLALFMHLSNVESIDHMRPYVYRIARNNCYDCLRRWQRREEVSIDADDRPDGYRVSFDLKDKSTPPDEVAHWLLLNLEVREAIDRLPQKQRQALILYTEANLSYAEIADVMEVSIGTVKSRIFHAKKTLRGMVRPEVLLAIQGDVENENRETKGVNDGREYRSETDTVPASLTRTESLT